MASSQSIEARARERTSGDCQEHSQKRQGPAEFARGRLLRLPRGRMLPLGKEPGSRASL